MNFFAWAVLKKRIIAIKSLMSDRSVPLRKKLLVVGGLVYLFLPFDIIPAVLFPVAWMDDLVLWLFIIWNLKDYLDKYWLGEEVVDITKDFAGKEVVDDVSFTVEGDGASGGNPHGETRDNDPDE
ncbi:MAG: DUF1232 domain-containing protein [Clostridiales Family XIII bacterium]|nr:DUF1232 domain-containing protein [Clostridiales Family XIII bacterium]